MITVFIGITELTNVISVFKMESKGLSICYVVPSYNGCMLAGRELRKGLVQNMHVCPEEKEWYVIMDHAVKKDWISGKFSTAIKEKMRNSN